MYYATPSYNRLLFETFLQIMNGQLYLIFFLIQYLYRLHSCIFSYNIVYYISKSYFIFSSACIMTFSLLYVYPQRKSTLCVHTSSCILMTLYLYSLHVLFL